MQITSVKWLNSEMVELSLAQGMPKMFATPLQSVHEGDREVEVQPGDVAMLVGQYLAIGEPDHSPDGSTEAPLLMTNYMRITGQENTNRKRRGINRGQHQEVGTVVYFR